VRKGGGMEPTERALALAGPLRAALVALEHGLEPTAAFDPAAAERSFTIMTNDFVAFALLPAPARARSARGPAHPPADPRLAGSRRAVGAGARRGRHGARVHRGLTDGHHATPLFEDHFVFIARKGHPLVRGKLTLATYTKLAHVLVSHHPTARGAIDNLLDRHGLTRDVALRVSHFLLVPPIVAATDYVAALSEVVARPMAASLPLQLLDLPIAVPAATVQMVWHERSAASPAHVWLRGLVGEVGASAAAACVTAKAQKKQAALRRSRPS
jgi:DNA-binding transcriptional LysR family regulator